MSELSGGVMLTEDALRCVARNIEMFYKKKAQNRDWCITTVRNAADQFEKMREEISTLRAQPDITGETSDGYHTFNELYHHRAVLFSVICNSRPDIAWKSKLHHDGTMYNGMFIVGINTPDGQATYHYDVEPYWEMFRVPELLQAPEWDGHTPAQAIERIGKLSVQPANEPLMRDCVEEAPAADVAQVVRKPVKGYEGYYEVDNLARVFSVSRTIHVSDNGREYEKPVNGKKLKQGVHSKGYKIVGLTKNGTTKTVFVHRIVAEAFLPNETGLPMVNHIDEDKTNNLPENLEWCTASYNRMYGNADKKHTKKIIGIPHTTEHNEKISKSLKKYFCSYGKRKDGAE